jgi:hypothetical protein
MKIGKSIVITGSITSIFGIIFHLQGRSIIGPESSFMHSNPDWITYGVQILIMGMIILSAGFIVLKRK